MSCRVLRTWKDRGSTSAKLPRLPPMARIRSLSRRIGRGRCTASSRRRTERSAFSQAAWCGNFAAPLPPGNQNRGQRSEEHTSELQSLAYLVCRLLLEKKNIDDVQFCTPCRCVWL